MVWKKAISHVVSQLLTVAFNLIAFVVFLYFIVKKFLPFSEGAKTPSQQKVDEAKKQVETVLEEQEHVLFTSGKKVDKVKDVHDEVKNNMEDRKKKENKFFF